VATGVQVERADTERPAPWFVPVLAMPAFLGIALRIAYALVSGIRRLGRRMSERAQGRTQPVSVEATTVMSGATA
jgi:hypothetical protein